MIEAQGGVRTVPAVHLLTVAGAHCVFFFLPLALSVCLCFPLLPLASHGFILHLYILMEAVQGVCTEYF